jgi:hypothetical protein
MWRGTAARILLRACAPSMQQTPQLLQSPPARPIAPVVRWIQAKAALRAHGGGKPFFFLFRFLSLLRSQTTDVFCFAKCALYILTPITCTPKSVLLWSVEWNIMFVLLFWFVIVCDWLLEYDCFDSCMHNLPLALSKCRSQVCFSDLFFWSQLCQS